MERFFIVIINNNRHADFILEAHYKYFPLKNLSFLSLLNSLRLHDWKDVNCLCTHFLMMDRGQYFLLKPAKISRHGKVFLGCQTFVFQPYIVIHNIVSLTPSLCLTIQILKYSLIYHDKRTE